MKRIAVALAFIIPSLGYIFYSKVQQTEGSEAGSLAQDANSQTQTGSVAEATTEPTPLSSKTSTPSPASANQTATTPSTGLYKNGTFTGRPAEEPYGTVQVAVVVSGGKITAVKLLQTPQGEGPTREINAEALPILVQETIRAQSAKIDAVSGASLTTPAYLESLQSALAKAKA